MDLSNLQKIAVLTDSCADLNPAARAGLPIYVAPLKIVCGDGEYSDGVDISAQDVYARLDRGEIPKTSLPDFGTVDEALDQMRADGYEKVIAIHLSSGLSGTYNMVRIHAQHRHDLEIAAFDSLRGAIAQGMNVLQICADIEAGMDWQELCDRRVPALLQNTFAAFTVDTLEYLVQGGRIGKISGMAGTLLNIKPIISFSEEGQLESVAKVRGRRQVQDKLLEMIDRQLEGCSRYNLAVTHGGAEEEMETFKARLMAAHPNYDHLWQAELDATLSVYIGKSVIGACAQRLD
ncbi:MAG: DegV family protein [Pseudoflavonifractor sp.]